MTNNEEPLTTEYFLLNAFLWTLGVIIAYVIPTYYFKSISRQATVALFAYVWICE